MSKEHIYQDTWQEVERLIVAQSSSLETMLAVMETDYELTAEAPGPSFITEQSTVLENPSSVIQDMAKLNRKLEAKLDSLIQKIRSELDNPAFEEQVYTHVCNGLIELYIANELRFNREPHDISTLNPSRMRNVRLILSRVAQMAPSRISLPIIKDFLAEANVMTRAQANYLSAPLHHLFVLHPDLAEFPFRSRATIDLDILNWLDRIAVMERIEIVLDSIVKIEDPAFASVAETCLHYYLDEPSEECPLILFSHLMERTFKKHHINPEPYLRSLELDERIVLPTYPPVLLAKAVDTATHQVMQLLTGIGTGQDQEALRKLRKLVIEQVKLNDGYATQTIDATREPAFQPGDTVLIQSDSESDEIIPFDSDEFSRYGIVLDWYEVDPHAVTLSLCEIDYLYRVQPVQLVRPSTYSNEPQMEEDGPVRYYREHQLEYGWSQVAKHCTAFGCDLNRGCVHVGQDEDPWISRHECHLARRSVPALLTNQDLLDAMVTQNRLDIASIFFYPIRRHRPIYDPITHRQDINPKPPVQLPAVAPGAQSLPQATAPVQLPAVAPGAQSLPQATAPVQLPAVAPGAQSLPQATAPVQLPTVAPAAQSLPQATAPVQLPTVAPAAQSLPQATTPVVELPTVAPSLAQLPPTNEES